MTDTRQECRLCGTPIEGRAGGEFCCQGCARVFEVISGMDPSTGKAYMEAARRLGIIPGGDAPPAPELPVDPEAVREERVAVSGLACPSCSWVAEQVMGSQEGVLSASVDFLSMTGLVRYDMRRTSVGRLDELLAPLGYGLSTIEDEGASAVSRRTTFDFIACAVILMNLMSLSVLRYMEGLGVIEGLPGFLAWVEMALTLPILWLGLRPMLVRAVSSLARGSATMDLLIATAVTAAFVLSLSALISGRPDIYFETAAGLVTISLLARMIEARLRQRAFREVATLMRMQATRVRRIREGREVYVPVGDVDAGDEVVFRSGETVVMDGVVAGGEVFVSEAVLTGEPGPVRRGPGEGITAGSSVVSGDLALSVTRRFDETRLHEIARSVAETLRQSEGRLRSADRIAAWFTPLVVAAAALAWVARLLLFGWGHASSAAGWFPSVAMLAVACPCAFSLAGVAALTAATGALVKRGILVRQMVQLESLHCVDHLVLDKTGTLTEGAMRVVDVVWRDAPREDLLPLVLAAEAGSTHPVAQAVRSHLLESGVTAASGEIEDLPGRGRVLDGTLRVGAASLFREAFDPPPSPGLTAAWFGTGEAAEGCFLISDRIRGEARSTLDEIRRMGLTCEILSGDRQEVVEWVGRELSIGTLRGAASLDEKVEHVRARRLAGRKDAYVGDGTNDALAMGEAAASVALARSTDEALSASGFVLMGGSISALATLLRAGRKLARVIRTNYVWAFAFNAVFIPVAAAGRLVPLAAMLLMLASSTFVLLDSLRMRRI